MKISPSKEILDFVQKNIRDNANIPLVLKDKFEKDIAEFIDKYQHILGKYKIQSDAN